MGDEAIICPKCKSEVKDSEFALHVASDHKQFIIPKAEPTPTRPSETKRGMNGREQLAEVIKHYPKAAIALFIFGCAFTFFALAWRW